MGRSLQKEALWAGCLACGWSGGGGMDGWSEFRGRLATGRQLWNSRNGSWTGFQILDVDGESTAEVIELCGGWGKAQRSRVRERQALRDEAAIAVLVLCMNTKRVARRYSYPVLSELYRMWHTHAQVGFILYITSWSKHTLTRMLWYAAVNVFKPFYTLLCLVCA